MKQVKMSVVAMAMMFSVGMLSSCGSSEEKKEEVKEVVTETPVEEVAATPTPGEELYKTSGCTACHKVEGKLVGPSIKDIAAAYVDEASLTAFLKGEAKAIVDPAQEAVMAPQLEVTKKMSAEDLKLIVDHIMSHK
ncbi:MAG: c-type cytochrome [Flavobacteriales bacterium]